MSNASDPVRWLAQDDALPEGVRASFARYADQGPNDQQCARMFAQVMAQVSETPVPVRRWRKLWLGLGLLAAGLAVWSASTWLTTDGSGHAPAHRDAPAADVASPSEATPDAPERAVPTMQDERSENLLGLTPGPASASDPQPRDEAAERQAEDTAARAVRPRRRGAAETLATSSPPTQTPADELALLTRARGLLATAADAALALTEEHRARFARGTFAQERELIAVEALARLGRAEEALTRGKAFLARFARSAHAERMRVILEGLTGEAAPSR